jgi:hypothetical protein
MKLQDIFVNVYYVVSYKLAIFELKTPLVHEEILSSYRNTCRY